MFVGIILHYRIVISLSIWIFNRSLFTLTLHRYMSRSRIWFITISLSSHSSSFIQIDWKAYSLEHPAEKRDEPSHTSTFSQIPIPILYLILALFLCIHLTRNIFYLWKILLFRLYIFPLFFLFLFPKMVRLQSFPIERKYKTSLLFIFPSYTIPHTSSFSLFSLFKTPLLHLYRFINYHQIIMLVTQRHLLSFLHFPY